LKQRTKRLEAPEMTILLLLALGAAVAPVQADVPARADPAAAILDPVRREAAGLCEPALAQEANGTVESIRVESSKRSGRQMTLSGDIQVFQKAAPPRPGELAPHHVISANFAFRCMICGHKVVKATVIPETN
jgi:hypothetical protein